MVIRTDSSSREQQSGNSNGERASAAATAALQLNQHIKRSAPQEESTTPIADAQIKSFTPVLQMLNTDEPKGWPPTLKVNEQAVPIKVLIDPQLIVSSAYQAKSTQPEVQSSNVDMKTSPLEKDTSDMVAMVEATKSHFNPSEQFVIEMDIKVRKHN